MLQSPIAGKKSSFVPGLKKIIIIITTTKQKTKFAKKG